MRSPRCSRRSSLMALGFVARPLGGIILGRVGDTHGRKTALLITIALMAVGTVLIGILPTYASIGVCGAAAAGRRPADAGLLGRRRMGILDRLSSSNGRRRTARLLRQLPADERRRRIAARLRYRGLVHHDPHQPIRWRHGAGACRSCSAAFWVRSGLWMRRTIDETPAYKQRGSDRRHQPRRTRRTRGCSPGAPSASPSCGRSAIYVLLNYMPTWSRQYLKITPAAALWANTIGLFVLMIAIPFMGQAVGQVRAQAAAAGVLHRLHRAALPDLQISGRRRVLRAS